MKVIDMVEIRGVQCGIVHISSNPLLRNGYYYVVKYDEVNQQLRFVTGGRMTKKKTEMVGKNFQSNITYILKLAIQEGVID